MSSFIPAVTEISKKFTDDVTKRAQTVFNGGIPHNPIQDWFNDTIKQGTFDKRAEKHQEKMQDDLKKLRKKVKNDGQLDEFTRNEFLDKLEDPNKNWSLKKKLEYTSGALKNIKKETKKAHAMEGVYGRRVNEEERVALLKDTPGRKQTFIGGPVDARPEPSTFITGK